jgi:hypothetical protein
LKAIYRCCRFPVRMNTFRRLRGGHYVDSWSLNGSKHRRSVPRSNTATGQLLYDDNISRKNCVEARVDMERL